MSKSGLWLTSQEKVDCPPFAGALESGGMHIQLIFFNILSVVRCISFFFIREKDIKSGENLLDRVQVEPQLNRCDICHYL